VNRSLRTPTVLITHNVGIAEMADRVIRLSDGRIADLHANTARKAARESARAAAAQAELARQEQERTESLRRSNFVSEQVLDCARSELARSEAAKLAADHAQPSPGSSSTLRGRHSPVDARILKRVRESEAAVQAGQALVEIGNPEALEVEVEVLSTQAVTMAPGTWVLFECWGGEGSLECVVRVVEPSGFTKVSALGVEEQRVRVIVDFSSPRTAWARLGDGYRVEARFIVWEGAGVLQVPAGALFRHRGGWAVIALRDGRAALTPVEIGQRAGAAVEVKAGVAAGDPVIGHPDDRVKDGGRVKSRAG
jgi:HlyD family secretion protein